MKKKILFISVLVLISLLLIMGCEEQAHTTTLQLRFMSDRETSPTSRDAVSPVGQGLTITDYTISGEGPNGNTFSLATSSAQVEINGLVIGTWNIHVEGLNQQGTKIAEGDISHHLTTRENRVEVVLDDFEGEGTVRLEFYWGDTEFTDIAFDLQLKPQGGIAETVAAGKQVDEASATATYEQVLSTGSYELVFNLYSEGTQIAGGIVAIRVLDGMLSTRTIPLVIDKPTPEATGFVLSSTVVEPVTGTIESIGSSILPNTPQTATFSRTGGGGNAPLEIDWYLDGSFLASGESIEFSTYTGPHRLDVIAKTDGFGSVGSETHPFHASVESMDKVPVMITSVSAGETDSHGSAYRVSGVSTTAFLRDGKLLIASSQGLQICELKRDQLQVITNYSSNNLPLQDNPYPTTGITDIIVDTFDDIVCTTARDSGIVVFYQYQAESSSLSKIAAFQSDTENGLWGQHITNADLNTATNQVFLVDRDSKYLFYASYGLDGVGPFSYSFLSVYPGYGTYDKPSTLRVDPFGSRLAIGCQEIGGFFTYSISPAFPGENLYFNFEGSYFHDNPNVAGPTDLYFSGTFIQTLMADGIHLHERSVGSMNWIDAAKPYHLNEPVLDLVLDGTQEHGWAIHGGGNPMVHHMDIIGGAPSYAATGMTTGTYIPQDISYSPKGDVLCISGENQLCILRVSDG
jgi:hypothetical protein